MEDDDLSYSFYADRGGYIDSENSIINNCEQTTNSRDNLSLSSSTENSFFINSPPDPIAVYTKRTREKWLDDSSTNNCKKCNATFRIYRRRHHCIAEGTYITCADGLSRKIEDIKTNTFISSHNKDFDRIENNKSVDTLFDQGEQKCLKLILEDGRELIATEDHEILVFRKKLQYVKMSNLHRDDQIICSAFLGVKNNYSCEKDLAKARVSGFMQAQSILSEEDKIILERDIKLSENELFQMDELVNNSLKREFIAAWFGNRKIEYEVENYTEHNRRMLEAEQINKWINELGVESRIEIEIEDNKLIIDFKLEMDRFAKLIGFRYATKKQIDLHLLNLNLEYEDKRYYSLAIKTLEPYKICKTYDLSVPQNFNFVANGIVVHNCYNCGDIFCDVCSSNRAKIPKVIKKIPTRTGKEETIDYNTPVRLCKLCFENYDSIHKLEKFFTIFSLLELTLQDFKALACVCKQWNLISAFYMSKFREIQYKLPKYNYNSWEKQALWTNRFLLKKHSIWETHVIRSIDNEEKMNKVIDLYFSEAKEDLKRVSSYQSSKNCWNRMCSRFCRSKIDPERALLLLDVLEKYDNLLLAKKIIDTFDTCCDYTLECYLPYILYKGMNNKTIKSFIFERCKNIRIANCVYWYLKNNNKIVLVEFLEIIDKDFYVKIIKMQNFAEMISNGEKIDGKMISIVNPELDEQEIYSDKIVIKESATRPTLIPGSKSSILYKKDDVRKDHIILCVIKLMCKILKENDLDIDIITYNVQPTSDTDGFIQIVENCETLYAISEKLKTTIINYLLANNPNETVSVLRRRFMMSCAVWSVAAYLFSLSDRNLENLLVTKNGQFFHIDHSFILGCDPKVLRTSCIRITTQMLDALGGENSKEYGEFKELCGTVYDILRKHVNTFVCLLSLIPTFKSTSRTSPNVNEEQMMIEIIKRFCPGEDYNTAIKNLKTKIDSSANSSTFTKYHIIDTFHKLNKEETLGSYFNYGYSNTKSMLSSMYSYLYSLT